MATFWNTYSDNKGQLGNFGSDPLAYNYSARIYIGSKRSERIVELPAFMTDLKFNVNKEIETVDEKDKIGNRYIQKVSTISMNLNIDVPAASAEEAKYNLIRVSEIMRMISPSGMSKGSETISDGAAKVYVLFSNLISRGNLSAPSFIEGFDDIKKHGLPGYIKDFDYAPDVSAGFFIDSDYRSPRNIKVAITLSIETIDWDLYENYSDWNNIDYSAYVMRGLSTSGEFTTGDSGGFPYGIGIRDPRAASATGGISEYNFESLNDHSSDYADESMSYFVIGNWYSKQKGKKSKIKTAAEVVSLIHDETSWNTPVYCRFKMFLEDYKFKKKTALDPVQTVNSDVGITYKNYSDNNSEFDIKFSVIADSLEQAKKNCGKIQILMRLFFTENRYDEEKYAFENYSDVKRNIYIPNVLERHDSSGVKADKWEEEYKCSIGCKLISLSVDHINDLGYFVETNDSIKKYYPKGFKISIVGAVMGQNEQYSGRPGNYNADTGRLTRNDKAGMIQFPFKFK